MPLLFLLGREKQLKKIKITKKTQEKELKLLRRKCLQLWTAKVKDRAGRKCEMCGKKRKKYLNAHHIEDLVLNKFLKFDARNGICICPKCHKFGQYSAHKSFCTMFVFMSKNRMDDFEYLLLNYKKKVVLTKEFLLTKIKELSR